jgi:hypothetical protein
MVKILKIITIGFSRQKMKFFNGVKVAISVKKSETTDFRLPSSDFQLFQLAHSWTSQAAKPSDRIITFLHFQIFKLPHFQIAISP